MSAHQNAVLTKVLEILWAIIGHMLAPLVAASLTAAVAWLWNANPAILIASSVATAGIVLAIGFMARSRFGKGSTPAVDREIVPQEVVVHAIRVATHAPTQGVSSPQELLAMGRQELSRLHPGADIRLELHSYFAQRRCLQGMCVEGSPNETLLRELPIRSHTPSGGVSSAGEAWLSRDVHWERDGPTSDTYKDFQDKADHQYGRSRSIYSVAILPARDPKGAPVAVLSLTSSQPDLYRFEGDRMLAGILAFAITVWFARSDGEGREHLN